MTTQHEELVLTAKDAINDVFGDKSVSQEQTIKSLDALALYIRISIEAIEEDLRRGIGPDSETL